MNLKKIAVLIALLLVSRLPATRASPCCGGGIGFPGLITGDFRTQAALSVGEKDVLGEASPQGERSFRKKHQISSGQHLNLEVSHLIATDLQAGIRVPYLRKEEKMGPDTKSDSGLGDLEFHLAYEFLPEYSYSPIRPRGFVFGKLSLDPEPDQARGSGFTTLSAGTLFFKVKGDFDLSAMMGVSHSLPKTTPALRVVPGWAHSVSLGAGYSLGKYPWRIGANLTRQYENPRKVEKGNETQKSSSTTLWEAGVVLSYLPFPDWSLQAHYKDQTLVPYSKNTTLGRSFLLVIQRNWSL